MFGLFRKKQKSVILPYHTDVHCHLLPGVDHGAQTIDDSIALIRREMNMGISRIFFTSHVTATTFENTPATLTASFETLKKALEESDISLETYCSAEYRLDGYWMKQRDANQLMPLPGNHLLLENSFQQELMMLDDLMFDIQLQGFLPILAHPERYHYYGYRHDRYRTLHNAGVKFQVNLLSLSGYYGTGAMASAEWLINNGFCDFLGSDMHNVVHAEAIEEYLQSKDWSKKLKKLEGRLLNDVIGV